MDESAWIRSYMVSCAVGMMHRTEVSWITQSASIGKQLDI